MSAPRERTETGSVSAALAASMKVHVAIDHPEQGGHGRDDAGLRERKHHLSAYLRKVKAGETVTITDRGTPIGCVVPAEDRDRRTLEEKLQALQDAGIAAWSGKKL